MEVAEPYRSRFLSRVDTSGGADACWPWLAGRDNSGYGVTNIGPYKRERAHRVAVYLDGRDIPAGMQIDHLCRNRGCANPAHLEVVTPRVNLQRAGPYTRKSHCIHGHPTPPGSRLARSNCRTCHNIQTLARWHARQAAMPPKAPKTHCKRGHLLAVDLYIGPNGDRDCRGCARENHMRRKYG